MLIINVINMKLMLPWIFAYAHSTNIYLYYTCINDNDAPGVETSGLIVSGLN